MMEEFSYSALRTQLSCWLGPSELPPCGDHSKDRDGEMSWANIAQAEPRETATENRPGCTQQGKSRKRGALRPEESFQSNLSSSELQF